MNLSPQIPDFCPACDALDSPFELWLRETVQIFRGREVTVESPVMECRVCEFRILAAGQLSELVKRVKEKNNMNKNEKLADRLKLAAEIAETGQEWQVRVVGGDFWSNVDPSINVLVYCEEYDWDHFEIRIKPESAKVPLGPEDVPPGSVIRGSGEIGYEGWCLITSCSLTGIRIWRECYPDNQKETTWEQLKLSGSQIKIPGEDWKPCMKQKVD